MGSAVRPWLEQGGAHPAPWRPAPWPAPPTNSPAVAARTWLARAPPPSGWPPGRGHGRPRRAGSLRRDLRRARGGGGPRQPGPERPPRPGAARRGRGLRAGGGRGRHPAVRRSRACTTRCGTWTSPGSTPPPSTCSRRRCATSAAPASTATRRRATGSARCATSWSASARSSAGTSRTTCGRSRPARRAGRPARRLPPCPPAGRGRQGRRSPPTTPTTSPSSPTRRDAAAREALWRALPPARPSDEPGRPRAHAAAPPRARARCSATRRWAAYATEDKMIGSAQNAADFIERIAARGRARCERDYAQLLARKREDDPARDARRAVGRRLPEERVKAEQYAFDSQALRPYFEYGRVKAGVLDAGRAPVRRRATPRADAPRLAPRRRVPTTSSSGRRAARAHLPRHAPARRTSTSTTPQFTLASGAAGRRLPEGVLVCNFPRPGAEPALLRARRGGDLLPRVRPPHAPHLRRRTRAGRRSRASRPSGTSSRRPRSCSRSGCGTRRRWPTFARHHETGEPMPGRAGARMRAADEFGKGLWVRQQMFYAARQPRAPPARPGRPRHDRGGGGAAGALHAVPARRRAPTSTRRFGHLDGYSAIYYTYMWSLVIAKDLFAVFRRRRPHDPRPPSATGAPVLEPGGSRPAAELVEAFLGRPLHASTPSRSGSMPPATGSATRRTWPRRAAAPARSRAAASRSSRRWSRTWWSRRTTRPPSSSSPATSASTTSRATSSPSTRTSSRGWSGSSPSSRT